MRDEQQDQEQYPYNGHDSKVWRPRVLFFGKSLLGILVILWGCSQIPKGNEDQFWNVFILGSVTWLILLTAWQQIGVTERQWEVMREQMAQTRELFDVVERPIIHIETVEAFYDAGTKTYTPRVLASNKGRTGAKQVRLKVQISEGIPPGYEPLRVRPIEIPFVPAGEPGMFVSRPADSLRIEQDALADAKNKEWLMALHICGSGTYRDMTKRKKYPITEFVYRFDSRVQRFVVDYERAACRREDRERKKKEDGEGNPS